MSNRGSIFDNYFTQADRGHILIPNTNQQAPDVVLQTDRWQHDPLDVAFDYNYRPSVGRVKSNSKYPIPQADMLSVAPIKLAIPDPRQQQLILNRNLQYLELKERPPAPIIWDYNTKYYAQFWNVYDDGLRKDIIPEAGIPGFVSRNKFQAPISHPYPAELPPKGVPTLYEHPEATEENKIQYQKENTFDSIGKEPIHDLLSELRAGKKLKKVEYVKKEMADNFLSEIKSGKILKPTKTRAKEEYVREKPPTDILSQIQNNPITQRNQHRKFPEREQHSFQAKHGGFKHKPPASQAEIAHTATHIPFTKSGALRKNSKLIRRGQYDSTNERKS